MNESNLIQQQAVDAINQKHSEILKLVRTINLRTKPRPPRSVSWYAAHVMGGQGIETIPSECADLWNLQRGAPLDKLARTFCVMEDFEAWFLRVIEAEKRHAEEMARQSASKIARLETYAISQPQKP